MPTRDIRTNLVLEGEQQYKRALDDAMQSVKMLGLQVKENATVYKLNADSVEGNRERIALLKKEMEQQQRVIDLYTQKIEANKAAGEGNSKETQQLEEKLIKARTALAAMNNELVASNEKLPSVGAKVKEVASRIGEGLAKAAETAAKVTVAAMTAISAACVAAGKAIYDLTNDAGQYADSMLTMSETTGVATQDLMKWEYASQFIDTSVETITGSLTKLEKNMQSSSADTAAAFEKLGIQVTDSTGQMRDDEEVFWEIIDALGQVDNATERDQLAMTLLGKSAKELNPLINAGSKAFKNLGDEAAAAGLIMSDESLMAFGEYDDAVNVMKSTITAAGRAIAEQFLPATKSVIEGASDIVTAFVGMVKGVEGSKEQFNTAINDMISNVTTIIDECLPMILDAGVEIVIAVIDGLTQALPKLADAALSLIDKILSVVSDNLSKILDIGFTLLMKFIDGLTSAIPKLMEFLPKIIVSITDFITENLPSLVSSGIDILHSIINGLVQTIPSLIAAIPKVITAILETITKNLPKIINEGTEILKSLIDGIIKTIPQLVSSIPKVVSAILDTFTQNLPKILNKGIDILKSLIDGIIKTIPQLVSSIPKVVSAILDTFTQNLPKILNKGTDILKSLIDGIIKTIPQLIAAIPEIIVAFISTVTQNLPKIINMGIEVLKSLISGILNAIPQLVAALPQVVSAILNGIGQAVTKIPEVGKNLIRGLWEGIKGMGTWLWDNLTGWFGNMMDGIKNFFGIRSPSKKMKDEVGKFLGLGIGEGFVEGLGNTKKAITGAIDGLVPDPNDLLPKLPQTTVAARAALNAGVGGYAASGSNTVVSVLSENDLSRLSDKIVDALVRAGFDDIVIKLNERELGRTMRRGLEAGFI